MLRSARVERTGRIAKRIGSRVKVAKDYELPQMRGMLGTVEQEYIHSEKPVDEESSRVLGVRMNDGRYELFWHHEVEQA